MSHEVRYGAEGGRDGDFLQAVAGAARENPVSAVLIGAGALWLCFGGSLKSLSAARHAAGATLRGVGGGAAWVGGATAGAASGVATGLGAAVDGIGQLGTAAARATGDVAQAVAAPISDAVSAASDGVRSAAGHPSHALPERGAAIGQDAAENGAGSIQGSLGALFARQPLALAAVGLAIGAGLAAAFPATEVENHLLGETSDALKEQARGLLADQAEVAQGVVRDIRDEIGAQGLTPSALAEAVEGVGEKLATVAKTARDAAAGRPVV
jgi:hypothetical protein